MDERIGARRAIARILAALLTVAFGIGLADDARAQPSPSEDENGEREAEQGNYPLSKAHVPEVDRATAKINQAREAAERKSWPLAVRNLQQVLEQYPQYVVELKERSGHFQGVREYCTQRLREMPPEALAVYRELFDERARTRYQEAMRTVDRRRLREVAETWPLSGWAHRAAGVLGSLLLEEGALREAIPFLELACASDLPEIARRWFLPLASAYTRIGDRSRLERLAERFLQTVGDTSLLAGGNPIDVARTIKEWAGRIAVPAVAASTRPAWDRWECFGGDATRSRPLSPSLDLPEKRWQATIPQGATPTHFNREFIREQFTPTGEETYTPYFPVVSDGVVYVHNDVQVLAFELLASQHGGRKLWAFPTPPRLPSTDVIFEQHAIHTATLVDGRLFVNLVWTRSEAERQLDWLDVKLPLPNRALIALDAQSGRFLWRLGGTRASEGGEEFADRASVASAPAAVGGDLYAGAVYQANATNPIEHYVCKVDAATGELAWRTNVCSGFLEMNLFNNPTRESVGTPVTVYQDLALYCTNMGVVAAVDTRTGRVRWLRRYRQLPIGPTRDIHSERMPASWANNPILVHEGRMFVAPTDSPYLYAYDVETGRELWSRIRNQYEARQAGVDQERFLLGILRETLILSGETVIALDLGTGRKRWTWRPPESNDRILGRGACTREHVYVPTRFKLHRLNPEGREQAAFKWYERDAGNVLIADNVLLSATPRMIISFFSMESIERQIAEELAKNPDDPYLRYRVGLSHQKADRWQEATKSFEEAIRLGEKRADRAAILAADNARQALYRMYIDLGRQAWDRRNRKESLEHFARAKTWARDDAAVVEIAFTVAALLHEADSHAESIVELQGVIDRHPDVPYARGTAREYARDHIQVILNAVGRAPYAPFEEQARSLLAAADRSGLVDDHARVVRRFPNSVAAETALLRSAEILYRAELISDALEQMGLLLEYRQSTLLPEAYRLLVISHEKRGTFTSARTYLMQLIRKFPDARISGDAGMITAREFVQQRLRRPEYQQIAGAGRRRELGAPLRQAWIWSDVGSSDLCLLTPGGPMPREATDLVFVASRGVVRAFRWNTGEEVWRAQTEKAQLASKCVFFDQNLVLAGPTTLFALSVKDGREQWRIELDEFYTQDLKIGEGLLFLSVHNRVSRDVMRLLALDAASGREMWSFPYRGDLLEGFFVGEEFVIVPTSPKDLTVLDREKGTQVSTISLPGRYLRLVQPGPSQLVAMTSRNALSCWDVATGKRAWQQETGLIAPDTLLTNQNVIAFVERSDSNLHQPVLVVLDPASGKRLLYTKASDGDFPAHAAIDENAVYVIFRERTARDRIYVSAFSLQDGQRQWMAPRVGKGSMQLVNPILSAQSFILNGAVLEQMGGRWSPVSAVINRSDGTHLQELTPDSVAQGTPVMTAENGVFAFVHGGQLFVFVGE